MMIKVQKRSLVKIVNFLKGFRESLFKLIVSENGCFREKIEWHTSPPSSKKKKERIRASLKATAQ